VSGFFFIYVDTIAEKQWVIVISAQRSTLNPQPWTPDRINKINWSSHHRHIVIGGSGDGVMAFLN
jgi:hypothetical protein